MDSTVVPEARLVGFVKPPHPEYFLGLDGDIMIEMERKFDGEPVYLKDQSYCIRGRSYRELERQ